MGILRKIEEGIVNNSPIWSNLKINLRGYPLYVDPVLKGTSRFSRKTGATVGLVNPEVAARTSSLIQVNSRSVYTDKPMNWLILGAIVQVAEVEKFTVRDYSLSTNLIEFVEQSKLEHPISSDIFLWAVPIITAASAIIGDSTFEVRSKHPLILNDVLAYKSRTGTFINVFEETNIIGLEELNPTTHEYPYSYQVTIDVPLKKSLLAEEVFYLRAYPAYFSPILKIPKFLRSVNQVGPHLLDWTSGRITLGDLSAKTEVDEFVAIQPYDRFKDKIVQDPYLINKNHSVSNMGISADTFLFWKKIAGTMKYTPNGTLGVCNDEGKFGMFQRLHPPMPNANWRIPVNVEDETILRIHLLPGDDYVEFTIAPSSSATVILDSSVDFPNLTEIEGILVTISSAANSTVEFKQWEPTITPQVDRYRFHIMAKTTKEAEWLSTSLIVKPYFYTRDFILSKHDVNDKHDAGVIHD